MEWVRCRYEPERVWVGWAMPFYRALGFAPRRRLTPWVKAAGPEGEGTGR